MSLGAFTTEPSMEDLPYALPQPPGHPVPGSPLSGPPLGPSAMLGGRPGDPPLAGPTWHS